MRPHDRQDAASRALTLKALSTPSIFTLIGVRVPVLRALSPRTRAIVIAVTAGLHIAVLGGILYWESRPGPRRVLRPAPTPAAIPTPEVMMLRIVPSSPHAR